MSRESLIDVVLSSPEGLRQLVAALKAEEDAKVLRRDLARGARTALKPAAVEAKSSIRAMSSVSRHSGPSLRATIARRISPQIRMSARVTGASVKARKITTRGFENAPKWTNRKKWRRMVFGDPDVWVDQVGKPNWFDDAMKGREAEAREELFKAMERMARRIALRSRG